MTADGARPSERDRIRAVLNSAKLRRAQGEEVWSGNEADAILAAGFGDVTQMRAERDAALAAIANVRELGEAMEAHPMSHQHGVDIRYALEAGA